MEYNLREYQAEALLAIQNHLRSNKEPCMVSIATGGGKSVIIAKLCEWCASHPDYNVLVLTHRKELLEQNFSKISHKSVGIVSSGLNKKDWDKQIIIAGIQSVWKKADKFKNIKLIIIDENHRVSNNKNDGSMYWEFLNKFPDARIVGLSGSPFRLKDGRLTWCKIVYHIGYSKLLELGFVAPLTNKILQEPDLSKLKIQSGEFVVSDMDKLYLEDVTAFNNSILKIVGYGEGRNCWIGFVPSVKMAEITKQALNHYGIITEIVSSKTKKKDRARILQEYKEGKIKCMINVAVLTEGFDNPNIDLLFCFRPTLSLSLWIQILGRTCRLSENKRNSLVLDFSGNLKLHGSLIDESWKFSDGQIIMPTEGSKGRICPSCQEYTSAILPRCICCGYEFLIEKKVLYCEEKPDTITDINIPKTVFKWVSVSRIDYEHNYKSKKGNIIPLKIIYTCGFSQVYRFIFDKQNIEEVKKNGKPKKIKINTVSKYPEIVDYDYE